MLAPLRSPSLSHRRSGYVRSLHLGLVCHHRSSWGRIYHSSLSSRPFLPLASSLTSLPTYFAPRCQRLFPPHFRSIFTSSPISSTVLTLALSLSLSANLVLPGGSTFALALILALIVCPDAPSSSTSLSPTPPFSPTPLPPSTALYHYQPPGWIGLLPTPSTTRR